MLRLDGVKSAYGRIEVLHGIDLTVDVGEIVALVGSNGAGKTTLLRAISGVQPVSGGRISLLGQDLTQTKPHARVAAGVAQVPEGRQIFGPLTVEDNLRLGAYLRRDREVGDDLERIYAMFPILKEKRRLLGAGLSGGQQQMLALGRALMARPKLLLLDEPSMGLAPIIVAQIFNIVRDLPSMGTTVFLVEQNAQAALGIADRGYVIETGRIGFSGSGRDLLADDRVRQAYLGV
ncbi:MAG: ABC transporter ATP-binding protein [Hyphomicrobiaceae bacterium]